MSYIAWHFSDGYINYSDGREIKQGQTYAVKWPYLGMMEPELCGAGFHGSLRAIDALIYAQGSIVSLCEIYGRVKIGVDKICGDSRRVLYVADASNLLYEFACWTAEEALKARMAEGYTFDPATFAAIQARRDFQAGKITKQELAAVWAAAASAARSAAKPAVESAAWAAAEVVIKTAAEAAARSAAQYATASAAWAAARYVVEGVIKTAAEAAARSAARYDAWHAAESIQNDELEKRLRQLFNI